ncbi:TRAP transporter small permease [Marinospirillum sp. MEB164]|uniref:TRAP transporter small permease protein n=1 Tax=Marinospirillum alkalitolerans TaxID=3123374 RepID=A0ABW8PVC7_9GAMM
MTRQKPTWLQPIQRVTDALGRLISRIESSVLVAAILLMAINTMANVIGRFALGESLHFAEEVNRILIVLVTFAGIGYAAREGRHIRMSAFYDLLPTQGRRYLMLVMAWTTSALLWMLSYYAFLYVQGVYGTGRVLPVSGIPVYWMYLWVPLGFALTALQYLLTGLKNLLSRQPYLSTKVVDRYAPSEDTPS